MTERRKTLVGMVVGDKMQKTAVVQVDRVSLHPRYHKYIRKVTKYKVHDEHGQAKLGDRVLIAECRPISRTKSWRLVKVLASASGVKDGPHADNA